MKDEALVFISDSLWLALTPTRNEASWHDDAERSGGLHPITESQRASQTEACGSLLSALAARCLHVIDEIRVRPARALRATLGRGFGAFAKTLVLAFATRIVAFPDRCPRLWRP